MGRKRFPKHWIAQQKPSAQRILDRCKGNLGSATRVIWHALNNPAHRNKAKKGLYDIIARWPKIGKTFVLEEQTRRQQMAQARPAIEPHLVKPDAQTSDIAKVEATV